MISSDLYGIIPFYNDESKIQVIETVNGQGEEIGLECADQNSVF